MYIYIFMFLLRIMISHWETYEPTGGTYVSTAQMIPTMKPRSLPLGHSWRWHVPPLEYITAWRSQDDTHPSGSSDRQNPLVDHLFPIKKPAILGVCSPFSDTAMYHYLVGKIPFLLDDFLQVHQCPHDLDVASGITWFSGSRIAELQHIIAGCIPGCIRLAFSGSHLSGLKHSHLTYFEEQWLLLADIVEARWKTQGNHGMTNRERWYGIEWHQNWWGAEQFFLPLHRLSFSHQAQFFLAKSSPNGEFHSQT